MQRRAFLSVATALLVASCGPTITQPTIGPDGKPLPRVYRIPAGSDAKIEYSMLDSVNALREAAGAPALQLDAKLNAAAATHARDVARLQTVTHVGSDGSKVGQRASAAGYPLRHVHENVGWTPCGFDFVLESWTDSPSHLQTMIRTDVSDYGIGRSGDYWVLITGQQG